MIKKGLTKNIIRTFYDLKKKDANDKNSVIQKPLNKRYLVDAVFQANKHKPKLLPPTIDNQKLTVVMEMDQVLSYTFIPDQEGYMMAPRRKEDFHLWFEEYECLLNIYKRKNLDNFLAYLSEQCEPVVFSTGVRSYVELVMSLIDPTKKIKHIITQQSCNQIYESESNIDEFVKDLGLLGRDLSKVVYLDSKFLSFWLYPENSLCMPDFKADNSMKNEDLDDIILQLQECRKYKDVRQYLLKQYNLAQDFKNMQLL